ncbi:SDR family oxidoreductase [Flavobacterium humi]|uniref:SDR family oxidoreductase n=1 Tax=Flavobacterium humi TaxID=2562683 RepID=A0A4Z0L2X9_9FLAO|nr:SDR family oxidoreductase [Flavobacterium humi]TGD56577.1 SDR family oxidoreductase [Flavobacterium humi]
MKIVIIGGTGLIGSKLVTNLRGSGHEVIAASPSSGINTITGEGLAEALEGAQVVVDVANAPSFEDQAVLDFFETSGRHLLAAEKAAGVGHHIALSVVGTDRLQESGYFRAKKAQEDLIREAGIPYTIVHSTQFFEFAGSIMQSGIKEGKVHMSPALIQPIASDDVVAAMALAVTGKPANGIVEIAGPEVLPLDGWIQKHLALSQDPKEIISDPQSRYFGAVLQEKTLLPGKDPHMGSIRYEDWFRNQNKT